MMKLWNDEKNVRLPLYAAAPHGIVVTPTGTSSTQLKLHREVPHV